MKHLIICLFLLPLSLYADPRMDTDEGYCHFVLNNANQAGDNESFMSNAESAIAVDNNNTVANGYCTAEVKSAPAQVVPGALDAIQGGNVAGKVRLTNADFVDLPCAMVESNGTTYNAARWISLIRWERSSVRREREINVDYSLRCFRGRQ